MPFGSIVTARTWLLPDSPGPLEFGFPPPLLYNARYSYQLVRSLHRLMAGRRKERVGYGLPARRKAGVVPPPHALEKVSRHMS